MRNISIEISAASTTSTAAIAGLTVTISRMEKATLRQGGSTFQVARFSRVNMALEVAVMRPARVPGMRSAK